MLVLSIVLCLGWVVAATQYSMDQAEVLFETFIQNHNRTYINDEEKQMKFNIFKENLQDVIKHNLEHGYDVMGINQFSDMSKEEFASKYLGCSVPPENFQSSCNRYPGDLSKMQAPASYDWRDKGVVTAVKSQGGCGSCWAFSVVGNVESQYAIQHGGQQLDLSEQQEVDCDRTAAGCGGGWPTNALGNLANAGGLMSEADYPYTERNGVCSFNPNRLQARVIGCHDFSGTNEEDIKNLLVQYGPLTVVLPADSMHGYVGGVLRSCQGQPNHALLVVGYGTDPTTNDPYWIIKNSWASSFGEGGYLRLLRGNPNCQFGQLSLGTATVA